MQFGNFSKANFLQLPLPFAIFAASTESSEAYVAITIIYTGRIGKA
jgi:hypothetical protein